MYFIGVDLGTSGVKLVLLNTDDGVVNTVTKSYPISYPKEGWSEQNPSDWLSSTKEGIRELLERGDKTGGTYKPIKKSDIAGVSFGGQMHGLVALDSKDNVLRPAILWNDGRTTKETDYLNNIIGKDKLSEWTANIAFAGFTAPKILWMKNNEPHLYEKINKIMLPKDYIAYMFCGEHSCDLSDASGMLLLDVKNRSYSKPMLEAMEIDENILPKLYESYEVVGTLRESVAEELGLSTKVKIIAGAGDNAAAAIGTGTIGDGACNLSLGTSGTIFITSQTFLVDKYNALHAFCHADGGYHLMGCMLSATSCNNWWCENILQGASIEKEQQGIEMLGDNHVFFLPYLMGERSPHNDPKARAAFLGMSMDTTRTQMTQAIMEGVTFGLRDSLEIARKLGITVEKTNICGGGAKSKLWQTMVANIMNLEVEIQKNDEGAGLGAAILAAVGCGAFKDLQEAKEKIVQIKEHILPDTELVKRYEERYSIFRQYYPKLKDIS